MRTMLTYIVLKPSLLMSLVPSAAVLLLIGRVGTALDKLPNSHTLPLEAPRKDS